MKAIITLTGGGSGVFDTLLSKGGASSWFVEGNIPYSTEAIDKFLGFKLDKYCSAMAAKQFAIKSLQKAIAYGYDRSECVGVGVSASLAKQEQRAGRVNEFYVSLQTISDSYGFYYKFQDDYNFRQYQELATANVINHIVKNRCYPMGKGIFEKWDEITGRDSYDVNDVMYGSWTHKTIFNKKVAANPVIYPGSFNPLHKGHADIVDWCNKHLNKKPYLEISVVNPDKPRLDYIDIIDRVGNIYAYNNGEIITKISGIIISQAPLFLDKIYAYHSPRFLLGKDTFNRVFSPAYYNKTPFSFDKFKEEVRIYDSRFYVLDRKGYDTHNVVGMDKHCHFVPISEYEDVDGISSTKIRK